jgi:hypothetical protein
MTNWALTMLLEPMVGLMAIALMVSDVATGKGTV